MAAWAWALATTILAASVPLAVWVSHRITGTDRAADERYARETDAL